jgi:hypothetical protein
MMKKLLLASIILSFSCRSSSVKIDGLEDVQDEESSEEQSESEEKDEEDWNDESKPSDGEDKPDEEDWNSEDKPDEDDWNGEDKPDEEDWDDEDEYDWYEEDSEVLLGDYTANFELYSGNFNQICSSTFDVSITENPYPDNDEFYSDGGCTTNNNIEFLFTAYGDLDYYNSEKAQISGMAVMSPPNGSDVYSEIYGTCYEFGGISFELEWEIDAMTPNGPRTFYAFLSL